MAIYLKPTEYSEILYLHLQIYNANYSAPSPFCETKIRFTKVGIELANVLFFAVLEIMQDHKRFKNKISEELKLLRNNENF